MKTLSLSLSLFMFHRALFVFPLSVHPALFLHTISPQILLNPSLFFDLTFFTTPHEPPLQKYIHFHNLPISPMRYSNETPITMSNCCVIKSDTYIVWFSSFVNWTLFNAYVKSIQMLKYSI